MGRLILEEIEMKKYKIKIYVFDKSTKEVLFTEEWTTQKISEERFNELLKERLGNYANCCVERLT